MADSDQISHCDSTPFTQLEMNLISHSITTQSFQLCETPLHTPAQTGGQKQHTGSKKRLCHHLRQNGLATVSRPLSLRRLRLAEGPTGSTERKLLPIIALFWTSAEKLSLTHPLAALLAKHLSFGPHLVHHHAVSALVPPFPTDYTQRTVDSDHPDHSPLK